MSDDNLNLNVAEETLRDVLAMHTAALVGEVAHAHGHPARNELQNREITPLLVRSLTAFVVGMRHPDARPPSHEELSDVLHGIALGVVDRVLTIVH